jgi:3-hydroxyisobutyrate dehydrogenase-like beta-hydroxyacid dehydrogenase
MKAGFIGLGQMGSGMAANLAKAGHEVRVYNRTRGKEGPLVALGATAAESIADACVGADAVFTMLANDEALRAVAFGAGGVLEALPKGAIHISSSTVSVALAEELTATHSEAGQRFISAPVMGRPEAAAAAKLFVMAAGAPDAVADAGPLFDAIGQKTFHLGDEPKVGNIVKLANNFLLACVIETVGEAMALTSKAGVDRHSYLDVLTSTLWNAPVYKTYGALIANEAFEPAGFPVPLGQKDVRLALEAAEGLNVPLPVGGILRDRFIRLRAEGGDALDWSAIAKLARKDAGLD